MARGASNRSGPAPDPGALRRDDPGDRSGWTTIPSVREGDPPAWPLEGQTDLEARFWAREWRRGQAVVWERNGQVEEVALYVRALAVAQAPDASTASRTLVRQQMEALGISMPGLMRNRWRIVARAEQEPVRHPRANTGRKRFRVVA